MSVELRQHMAFEATRLSGFRRQLLSLVDPCAQGLPPTVDVAYVWPTELCSIGCAHCSFASPKVGPDYRRRLAGRAGDVVQWLSAAGCKKLVACGGGEPLEEPDFILQVVSQCAQLGIAFEIYTSGTSLNVTTDVRALLRQWNSLWREHRPTTEYPSVRLSIDAFHEERIGLGVPASWIRLIEEEVPEWTVALRGVRLVGDDSLGRLANLLGAQVIQSYPGVVHLKMPSGRKIKAEFKGIVFDGRSSLSALRKRHLELSSEDGKIVSNLAAVHGNRRRLGRPLSSRLTVTTRRMDLEIHSSGVVHALEAHPTDTRLNLLDFTWSEIRDVCYRDPLLHRVAGWGLPAVARLIERAVLIGIAPKSVVPYSVDLLTDRRTLDVVSAMSLLLNQSKFVYTQTATSLARERLAEFADLNDFGPKVGGSVDRI